MRYRGGIADFGDTRAAEIIQALPGYDRIYRDASRYHQTPPGQPWAATFSLDFAKKFARFAGHRLPQSVVKIRLDHPEAIIMRGKLDEAEIVVDSGWIGSEDAFLLHA